MTQETPSDADLEAPVSRDKSQKDVRNVIIIIPFGVPGTGKSHIRNLIKEKIDAMDSA